MSKWAKKYDIFIPKSWMCLRRGYRFDTFKKDLCAGVTAGIVALPLAMAFAIASGGRPEQGLYTAIVAGFLISLLGGSRLQIGGPTGAFVVIIYDVIQRQGYGGLVIATLIAAVLLIIMGLCRLGTLIKYIPYPLTTGFTTGIALVLFSSQVKDFFGLKIEQVPVDFVDKWSALFHAFGSWDPTTVAVSMGTLCFIVLLRRFAPVIPWGIASIVGATVVCWAGGVHVETIASRFGELPRLLPMPALPSLSFNLESLRSLFPDAITIALLAGIESLIAAVIADGMTGGRHKSNCELIAQGVANIGSMLFGGIPATGAIARTATNVKTGARTPVAGMIHALTLFFIILFFAPIVSHIPLPALSATLIMVAWNMSELPNFRHLLKAPGGDIAVLFTAFFLTIFVDLTVAVEMGVILAAFLFMKRMGDLSAVVSASTLPKENKETSDKSTGIGILEINGPFFFGTADRLKDMLHNMPLPPRVFILRMSNVPIIDATGLHTLKELHYRCVGEKRVLLLSGVQEQPAGHLKKYGIEELIGSHHIFPTMGLALLRAHELVEMP